MKKMITGMEQIFKRAVCVLLIACTLSITVAGDYYEARYCEAAATGTALTLTELVATVLLSLGVTCELSSDIARVAQRVGHGIETWTTEAEREIMREWEQRKKVNVSNPDEASLWSKLKAKVRSLISDADKSKAVPDSNIGNSSAGQTVSIRNGLLSDQQLMGLFNDVPIYLNGDSSRTLMNFSGSYPGDLEDYSSATPCFLHLFDSIQMVHKDVSSSGALTITLYTTYNGAINNIGELCEYLQVDDASVSLRSAFDGSSGYKYFSKFVFTKANAASKFFRINTFSMDKTTYNYAAVQYQRVASVPLENVDVIYSRYGAYDSFQDFVDSNMVYSTYPLAGSIFGDASVGFDDSKDFVFMPDVTQQVQDAIQDYVDQHPDATDDEKNDVAAGVISSITDVSDKVDDATDEITAGNTWLEKIYNYIKSKMNVTMSSVQSSIVAVGGISDDILDETKKTSGKLSTVANWLPGLIMEGIFQVWNSVEQRQFRNDLFAKLNEIIRILNRIAGKDFAPTVNSPPVTVTAPEVNVTVPAPEVDVTVSAPQVMVENKTDLSGIEQALSSILSALGSIREKLDAVPGKTDALIGAVEALPEQIAEPVINVTAEVPDVIVPEIKVPEIIVPEIVVPKAQVVEIVKEVFVIDPDRIHADADKLLNGYSGHFPDLKALLAIILLFNFASAGQEYPVFEFTAPEFLQGYLGTDTIILMEFEAYAEYFTWARNLIRAFIWIHFIYAVFGHFKVRFSIS